MVKLPEFKSFYNCLKTTKTYFLARVYKSTINIKPLNFSLIADVIDLHFLTFEMLRFCCNSKMVKPRVINVCISHGYETRVCHENS